jgi:hypothetical protein
MIAEVDAADVRTNVQTKGFQKEKIKGRDHEKFFLWVNGQKTSWWVKLSHGVRSIRVDEISNNARALGIRGEDLYKILNCTHSPAKTLELYQQTEQEEAALACASCAENVTPEDVKDDRERLWHFRCATIELTRAPWQYDRAMCPSCGGAPDDAPLPDTTGRQWHLACAASHLATVTLY